MSHTYSTALFRDPRFLAGLALGAAGAAALAALRRAALHHHGAKAWDVGAMPALTGATREERLVTYVFATATRGDSASVLRAMDDFCYNQSWMMAVGDIKGIIVRQQVEAAQPKLSLEFGGYCGYSAVLIGSLLKPGARLVSIEINPVFAALATKLIEHAGLSRQVEVWVGDVPTVLPRVVEAFGCGAVDFVFIDHWKEVYLRDIKNLESAGLLHAGSVVVGDNILTPGAPDYLAFMQSNPAYSTVLHETLLEYQTEMKDAVSVSVRL